MTPQFDVETLIVIPARYGSTRFPGKPLAELDGKSMLHHVSDTARRATELIPNAQYVVATDDQRIADHCASINAPFVMTDKSLTSGSDRALAAAMIVAPDCEYIINLQGDAPFTPASYLQEINRCLKSFATDAATPVIQLSWRELDQLRIDKETTPHSGTCCICGPDNFALWFSKNIIPSIRNEASLRGASERSPVLRHVGLYGYRRTALARFNALPPSTYEKIEGLEQLRLLENGLRIYCARVEPSQISTSGIDTPEDLARLERLISRQRDQSAE